MSAADLLHRHRQVVDARDRLDSLLDSREAALEGRGIAPSPSEIDRARAALETAQALLLAAEQDFAE